MRPTNPRHLDLRKNKAGDSIVAPYFPDPMKWDHIPDRVCNASQTQTYTGTKWNIREGGEAHKQFSSRGLG